MKSKKVNNQPQEITDYPEIDPKDQNAVECINEIFMSPLTGSYNWDYTVVEDRIKKLYELGKELNWNVSSDLDWSESYPKDQLMINYDLFQTPESVLRGYDDLSDEKKIEMDRHRVSWNISQFLHGEQGALLVASQLVSCAPLLMQKCMPLHKLLMRLDMLKALIDILRKKLDFSILQQMALSH